MASEPDAAMSQPNPFTANGTCYTRKGARADSAFIPCGNAAFGPLPCWCTDPEYSDEKCPQKQFGEFCRW